MKKSMLFAVLSAGIVLAGCGKEEFVPSSKQDIQTPEAVATPTSKNISLPDDYAAPLSQIPEGAGAVKVAINGIDPEARSVTFLADGKISGNFTLTNGVLKPVEDEAFEGNCVTVRFGSYDLMDGTANFLFPVPAGEYHDYSVIVRDGEGNLLYMKSEPEDANFTVTRGEVTQLGGEDAITKATTSTTRPWQSWTTVSRSSSSAVFGDDDNRYSVGQFLGGGCIMQNFHVLGTGTIVYTQNQEVEGVRRNLRVVKCTPKHNTSTFLAAEPISSYNAFVLKDFSHGGGFCVEERDDGQYVWVGACGVIPSGSVELKNHQAYACFKPTYSFNNNNIIKEYTLDNMSPSSQVNTKLFVYAPDSKLKSGFEVSVNGNYLCVEYPDAETGYRYFYIYTLASVKAVTPKQYTVKNIPGVGKKVIYARNIADATGYVGRVVISNPDLAFQGFDFAHPYSDTWRIYALFGESLSTASTTSAYIATKEYIGAFNNAGSQCNKEYRAVKAFYGQTNTKATLKACGYSKVCSDISSTKCTYAGYAEVEGIKVARNTADQGVKLYVGFAAHDSADKRRANVLKYNRY